MSDVVFSTFVMNQTTVDQIRVLPAELQLKYFWAVANYGMNGEEPEFSNPLEKAIWIPMRDLIFNSKQKNEEWRGRQRVNGLKGGRPKNNKPENPSLSGETEPFSENPSLSDETEPFSENPSLSGETHKYNDKYNDKYNENVNLQVQTQTQENPEIHKPPGAVEVPAAKKPGVFVFFSRLQKKDLTLTLPQREDAQAKWNIAVEVWNELTLDPKCRDLIIPPLERENLMYELGKYACGEVLNAIGNLAWHRFDAVPDKYKPPPPYGSLAGFIRSGGIGRYVDDAALDSQFLIGGGLKPDKK
jgi:hypothetical protein